MRVNNVNNNVANMVVNEIKSLLGTAKVEWHEVEKNNGVILHGVSIRYEDETIIPTIYIENFIDNTVCEIAEIAKKIIMADIDARKNLPQINPEDYTDISKVIDKICLRLINYEQNKELLTKIPYQKFYDMAVILVIELSNEMSIKVTNEIIHEWKKYFNVDWIFNLAKFNTEKNHPEKIRSMIEVIAELMGMPVDFVKGMSDNNDEIIQYVLTNNTGVYGATCFLYDGILERCAKIFNSDFAILPSSIHELILVPIDNRITTEALNDMIKDVNKHEVKDEDVLSDHAYIYRVNTGKIEY